MRTNPYLPRADRLRLEVQRAVGWTLLPLWANLTVALMRWGARYRVLELHQVRRRFLEAVGARAGPLLVCANHLTLIDSAVIEWALASNWTYWRRFWLFPWSLPERRNYAGNPLLRLMCYLGKCVPVVRGGPPEDTRRTLDKLRYLLRRGEVIFIFPEGTRSRSGRVDAASVGYGVGRLLSEVPATRVLCVYLRGEGQRAMGKLPRRGERFYADLALLEPRSEHRGLRAARDFSYQIVEKLARMEERFFERVRPDWQ